MPRVAQACCALAVVLGCALAGCGQKGPLYLPDSGPVVVRPAAAPVMPAVPEEDDDEDKGARPP